MIVRGSGQAPGQVELGLSPIIIFALCTVHTFNKGD